MERIEPIGPRERDIAPVLPVRRRDTERELEQERERRRREREQREAERLRGQRPPAGDGDARIDVQA